jgi:isopentenyl-diphosphate delta-isomerase
VFIFNAQKLVLLTKRATKKKTFPGVWTNTVCGHPGPGESVEDAAKRRLHDELGMVAENIHVVAPYQYCVKDESGIVENEICPILIGFSQKDPRKNDDEVDEWKWVQWTEFLKEMSKEPKAYSPWCQEEALILQANFNR